MSVAPIDLQINMNRLYDAGKAEQERNMAASEQVRILDDEAAKASALKKDRLDESKKFGETIDAAADREKKKNRSGSGDGSKKKEKKVISSGLSKDSRLGNIIDFLR